MHNHGHSHCQHNNVKYCHHCNVCYCVDCNEEWGNYRFTYTYPQTYRWIYYGTPYTITWDNTGDFTMTNSGGQMVNDTKIRTAFTSSSDYKNISSKTNKASSYTACTHN